MDETFSNVTISKTIRVSDLKSVLKKMGTPEKESDKLTATRLTLYARVNRRCWLVGATHEHETYVEDEKGNRFSVDRLVLHSDIGGDRQDKEGTNTSQVARTETELNMGCRSSACKGTATHWGVSWSTDWARV